MQSGGCNAYFKSICSCKSSDDCFQSFGFKSFNMEWVGSGAFYSVYVEVMIRNCSRRAYPVMEVDNSNSFKVQCGNIFDNV